MFKKIYLLLILIIGVGCSSATEEETMNNEPTLEVKPNILLIIADDLGKDAMPNFSEGTVKPSTPNLTSLMNSGLTFDNFWSYPVCTPTRASILTGKYGIKTNVIEVGDNISTSETSLQKYLKKTVLIMQPPLSVNGTCQIMLLIPLPWELITTLVF
tara:strand:+ start:195007 stop:195477 length:471 start_codon:yes stop_codon:yes gene_type:complete